MSSERIVFDQGICGGRPRIAGTRMPVSDILELISAGITNKEIIADYPYLKEEDISAALSYAALAVDHRVIKAA